VVTTKNGEKSDTFNENTSVKRPQRQAENEFKEDRCARFGRRRERLSGRWTRAKLHKKTHGRRTRRNNTQRKLNTPSTTSSIKDATTNKGPRNSFLQTCRRLADACVMMRSEKDVKIASKSVSTKDIKSQTTDERINGACHSWYAAQRHVQERWYRHIRRIEALMLSSCTQRWRECDCTVGALSEVSTAGTSPVVSGSDFVGTVKIRASSSKKYTWFFSLHLSRIF